MLTVYLKPKKYLNIKYLIHILDEMFSKNKIFFLNSRLFVSSCCTGKTDNLAYNNFNVRASVTKFGPKVISWDPIGCMDLYCETLFLELWKLGSQISLIFSFLLYVCYINTSTVTVIDWFWWFLFRLIGHTLKITHKCYWNWFSAFWKINK